MRGGQGQGAQASTSRSGPEPTTQERITELTEALAQAHASLAKTRRVLVRELVQVFNVTESSATSTSSPETPVPAPIPFGMGSVLGNFGRRAKPAQSPLSALSHSYHPASRPFPTVSSASASTSRSPPPYAIATLILPSHPAKLQRLPPEHVQAVIPYLLQFMRLLTFYMGVKLPFEIMWDGGAGEGVGRPWICASKGTDDGGWSKYSAAQPLHPPPPLTLTSANSSPTSSFALDHATSALSSTSHSSSSPARLIPSFTTGLAMLNYNISYLLYTQGIRIPPPLHPAPPDALRNLVMLCFSPLDSVGLYSHDAMRAPYRLSPPTGGVRPSSAVLATHAKGDKFDIEFADMLKLMHAAVGTGTARVRKADKSGGTGEDDWDLERKDLESGAMHAGWWVIKVGELHWGSM